ncbi:MAG: hypothetical protein ACYC2T_09125 [Bacillota bacterium]
MSVPALPLYRLSSPVNVDLLFSVFYFGLKKDRLAFVQVVM